MMDVLQKVSWLSSVIVAKTRITIRVCPGYT